MSGIAGIYHRDGRPVERELLQRMTELIAHRGPDGTGCWIDGPVGMSHQMFHTTPESLHERQPLVDESANLCLIFDGRVDNHEDLRRALKGKDVILRTNTDAELVLQAYACWGEQCPAKIIGDFAFVIWDGRARQLFCARDIQGAKPFYYYLDKQLFIWGSELGPLFAVSAVAKEPNLGMIGEYLIDQVTNLEETVYIAVMRLPPAHYLIITVDRICKVRYWDIDPAKEIYYSTDTEYAEHFLEIFRKAVRCRLRSQAKVGACLSGGLDSSSIVCMAQSLYKSGTVADPGFETFSLIFPGLPCDEGSYIQSVVDWWDLRPNYIHPFLPDLNYYTQQIHRHYNIPHAPNGVMSVSLEKLAQEKGFRVILSGAGGDEWFTGSDYRYVDMLYNFKLISLFQQICSGLNIKPFNFIKLLLRAILPERLARVVYNQKKKHHIQQWVRKEFAEDIHLLERTYIKVGRGQFNSFAQADIHRLLSDGWRVYAHEAVEQQSSGLHVDYRFPFNDRRLVEFSLALPEEQRWRSGRSKFILRNAMQGMLPANVQQRTTKAEFSAVFEPLLTAQAIQANGFPFSSSRWVYGERVHSMYTEANRAYAVNQTYNGNLWILWNILAIYLWLTAVLPDWLSTQMRKQR